MSDFIYKETVEGVEKKYVYTCESHSFNTTWSKREVLKETATQIKTEHRTFNKKTGREVGSDNWRGARLCTKQDYIDGRVSNYEVAIEKKKARIAELRKEADQIDCEVAKLEHNRDAVRRLA